MQRFRFGFSGPRDPLRLARNAKRWMWACAVMALLLTGATVWLGVLHKPAWIAVGGLAALYIALTFLYRGVSLRMNGRPAAATKRSTGL